MSSNGGGQAPPAPATHELDPHDLVRILVRRKWVIAGTLATVLLLSLAYLWQATRLYTATTTLEVSTQAASLTTAAAAAPLTAQDEIRINTHLELLAAPALGEAVVKDLNLDKDPEFRPDPDRVMLPRDPEEAEAARIALVVGKLFDKVEIERVGQSALIRVNVTTTDPEKSAEIADIIAGTHRKNLLRESRSSTTKEIKSLEQRADELRSEAIEGERAAVAQGQQAGLPGGGALTSGQSAQLASQLSDARAQRVAAETRFAQLGGIGGGASGPGLGASPLLADLRAQQAALDKRIAELSAQFGPGHPDMQAAEAQRAGLASRLADEMARVRREAAAEVAAARAREGQIAADLAAARGREMTAGQASVAMSDLQHSAATNRELYLTQLARLQELRGKEQSIRPEVSIAAKALVPTSPSSPNASRMLAAAVSGGLILGIILAFAVELFDRKLRTADQVARVTGLPTLAMVPELSREDAALTPAALIQREPTAVFAETIRSLCLDLIGRGRGTGRCLVITSPLPLEGKTMLTVSIASSAALLGRKVVVVDLDLRRPGVARTMALEPTEPDLLSCLEGEGPLDTEVADRALVEDPACPRLAMLTAARAPANPGDLLASPRLGDLIRHLRRRHDFVLLNAPPILPVRDAKHLATFADATLLVVRWGRTSPEALRNAKALLGNWATAVVINRVDLRRHAASQYGDRLQHYGDYSTYFSPARSKETPGVGS
jgi:uncharacterized protein involved in exopolysaccharide biosynthesis/cellulose biosynthesis protein BcsQ